MKPRIIKKLLARIKSLEARVAWLEAMNAQSPSVQPSPCPYLRDYAKPNWVNPLTQGTWSETNEA